MQARGSSVYWINKCLLADQSQTEFLALGILHMRLYASFCTTCSKTRDKMPTRVVRSVSKEKSSRPPCGIITVTSWQGIRDEQLQQHSTRSWPGGYKATNMEPTQTKVVETGHSRDPRRRAQSVSCDMMGNSRSVAQNKPLIHHQRHSLKNKFQVLQTLGEGTYGKVKLAIDKGTGEQVAIKYIKKTKIQDKADQTRIRREIQILSSLRHEHIVNVREVFEKKDKIVLVMDYAPGGELYDYLNKMGRLPEEEARRIFRQIVSALHHCHQNGVVHRDLKLENIILDSEGNVKIADFGLSNYFCPDSTLSTFCGSPLYASPEIVNGKPYQGPEVDVWSLGVILYTLVYGAMPFESSNVAILRQQISHGLYSEPIQASEAAGLIHHMLTVAPSRRATMEDILHHWWVNFSYPTMPNNLPYKLDPELTDTTTALAVNRNARTLEASSAFSADNKGENTVLDSDVELHCNQSLRSIKMVSDDQNISISSPEAVSLISDVNSNQQSTEDFTKPAHFAASKLPQDVLEILLKGCSKKTLKELFGSQNVESEFDVDTGGDGYIIRSKNGGGESRDENSDSVQRPPAMSESGRMPARGILKRKGKFSGGDSGCVINEEMSRHEDVSSEDSHPHLKPHRRGDNDAFGLNEQSSNIDTYCNLHDNSCTSISHSALNISSCLTNSHQGSRIQQNIQGSRSSQDILQKSILGPTDSEQEDYSTISAHDKAKLYYACGCKTTDNSAKIVTLPKSILNNCKRSSLEDGIKRLSLSSYGSNSSIDMFDLSYDSADSGHFVNPRPHFSITGNINHIDDNEFGDERTAESDHECRHKNDSKLVSPVTSLTNTSETCHRSKSH